MDAKTNAKDEKIISQLFSLALVRSLESPSLLGASRRLGYHLSTSKKYDFMKKYNAVYGKTIVSKFCKIRFLKISNFKDVHSISNRVNHT